jgi:hypothetical protein
MFVVVASSIMARTTLNLDTALLEELKRLQEKETKSLGELVSELVAEALVHRARSEKAAPPNFRWITGKMGARVDLSDKEAVYAALEEEADAVVRE